jgi:hypothetical protein
MAAQVKSPRAMPKINSIAIKGIMLRPMIKIS